MELGISFDWSTLAPAAPGVRRLTFLGRHFLPINDNLDPDEGGPGNPYLEFLVAGPPIPPEVLA